MHVQALPQGSPVISTTSCMVEILSRDTGRPSYEFLHSVKSIVHTAQICLLITSEGLTPITFLLGSNT